MEKLDEENITGIFRGGGGFALTVSKTLYANRPLLNVDEIREWAKSQGFTSTLGEDDMHVTIAYSKEKFDWEPFEPQNNKLTIKHGERKIEQFGDATVLTFTSKTLSARWKEFRKAGASWDFPHYIPHITISYETSELDLKNIKPFTGDLIFGPESLKEVQESWADDLEEADL